MAQPQRYYRKVIHISALDSPNVQARRDVLPGVLSYREYCTRRATWDAVRQCIGLMGQFWEGAELLLFPPEWLNRAEELSCNRTQHSTYSHERWLGCDPGEGGANTCWSVVDRLGLLKQVSAKTPNTDIIPGITLDLMHQWSIPAQRVVFDRGGGGKQHADRLAAKGFKIHTVGFGESVSLEPRRGIHQIDTRIDVKEDHYAYKNRRAQMYGDLSEMFDPINESGFALPPEYVELRRQLALMPKLFDDEGRMYLPPKQRRDDRDTRKTLTEIIGRSPDEADSLAVAVYGMLHARKRPRAYSS